MNFQDLPKGGSNLRLYTYDPLGSAFYKSAAEGGFLFNTGHYDIALPGGPCSQVDPMGFNDFPSMSQYAASRGESLVLVTRNDLNSLCAYRAPLSPGAPVTQAPITGVTLTTPITPVNVTYPPGSIPPPGTPIAQGGLPGGGGQTAPTAPGLTSIYRFILHDPSNPAGPWSTGSNHPGCSAVNRLNCDPQAFHTEADAIAYADAHGEIPYLVSSADEVWQLMNGSLAIDPNKILKPGLPWWVIPAGILAAKYFLFS